MTDQQQEVVPHSAMILEKSIYPKRKSSKFGKEEATAVLNLEVETHLRQWPQLVFDKLGDHKKNSDGSVTYPLHFKMKEKESTEK